MEVTLGMTTDDLLDCMDDFDFMDDFDLMDHFDFMDFWSILFDYSNKPFAIYLLFSFGHLCLLVV